MPAPAPDPRAQLSTLLRAAAVIFDFDETIIDLEPQHLFAHDALCRAQGSDFQKLPAEIRLASGRRIIDDIRDMRAHFGWSASEEELFAMRQRFFDDACRGGALEPMEGVRELIDALREHRVRMAIASSAVRASIETILGRLGLRDAFELIVDGSEVARGKPDPESYLLTARKLGVDANDCVVLEDSEVGVLAAKRAGMLCIAIRNPRAQMFQDLSAADAVLTSLRELTSR